MPSLSIKAPAKLNLFLRVLAKRRNGYHNIQSLFERISLFDNITIRTDKGNKILFSCDCSQLPKRKGNLAYKAADILREKFSIKDGVAICLKKNIPVGAGLGGGSTDAAAVLLALNRLWKLKLGSFELLKIAAQLGSDVPFFVKADSFSLVTGRGQHLHQVKTDIKLWHILVVPRFSLSTRAVYERFDKLEARPKRRLTRLGKGVNMITRLSAKSGCFSRLRPLLGLNYNSLEGAAASIKPQIVNIKQILHSLGVKAVRMSGSGPSLFAILRSRKEAEHLKKRLARFKGWRTFVVKTF